MGHRYAKYIAFRRIVTDEPGKFAMIEPKERKTIANLTAPKPPINISNTTKLMNKNQKTHPTCSSTK